MSFVIAKITSLECKSLNFLKGKLKTMAAIRPSSNMAEFREILKKSKNIMILSGAGVSVESGIPTFRGAGGYWRNYNATNLATPEAFEANPSLVWEFYHHRRETARKAQPNAAHIAIAEFEKTSKAEGRNVTLVTQNIDNLHVRAGSQDIIELHGNLYKTRCTKCKNIFFNDDSPICEALDGKGVPDPSIIVSDIPVEDLPRCKMVKCKGLLRPHIIWFGENLERDVIDRAQDLQTVCDACIVVGTSSVVYPAAMFAPQAAARGVPVAEFNVEETMVTQELGYFFQGPCGTTLPELLNPLIEEAKANKK